MALRIKRDNLISFHYVVTSIKDKSDEEVCLMEKIVGSRNLL